MESIIVTLTGFIATFMAAITPVIKLNSSITQLNTKMDSVYKDVVESKHMIQRLQEKNQGQEIKIVKLEEKK